MFQAVSKGSYLHWTDARCCRRHHNLRLLQYSLSSDLEKSIVCLVKYQGMGDIQILG